MRLRKLQEEFGDLICVEWRSFPLMQESRPAGSVQQGQIDEWTQARKLGEFVEYLIPELGAPRPGYSMPALEADVFARSRGRKVGSEFHLNVMKAYFAQGRDISAPEVLEEIAWKVGLDGHEVRKMLATRAARAIVLKEWQEGIGIGVTNLPTVVFTDGRGASKIVGDVPLSSYRRMAKWFLST